MRIVTFALMRAQKDAEKAKYYPKAYVGTKVRDSGTYIYLRIGREPKRRTIAIPHTSIVTVSK